MNKCDLYILRDQIAGKIALASREKKKLSWIHDSRRKMKVAAELLNSHLRRTLFKI